MAGVFAQYNGDSLYLAAFVASLGLLYYREKRRNHRDYINHKKHYGEMGDSAKKAVTALVLALFAVFNEAAYLVVGKLTDSTTYYRFFWMLPVLFVIAYILTEAFTSEKRVRIAAAAVAFAVCLAVGENLFFLNRTYWNLPQNIYGLDANTITIADEIMADWGRTGKQAMSGQAEKTAQPKTGRELADAPVAAFDMFLEYQVRTYEPRIRWGLTRKAYLYQAEHGYDHKKYSRQQYIMAAVNEGMKEDSKMLRHCLDKNGINYLAIRTEFDMDEYLAEISVLPIAHSVSYTLYKVKE